MMTYICPHTLLYHAIAALGGRYQKDISITVLVYSRVYRAPVGQSVTKSMIPDSGSGMR